MRIGVVGGGITGLTVARGLCEKGHEVTVFEKSIPGGLAAGVAFPQMPGVFLDKYYHHFFQSDSCVIQLILDLGLGADLEWIETRSGLVADGRAWPLGTPGDLLACAPVGSLWQRLLMGLNLLYFRQTGNWRRLDRISCREFFERRLNLKGYRNLWEPLLRQKFADHFDNIPASFLWGRIYPRARSKTKGKETLGYLKGGFQRLILALADSLRERGGTVSAGNPVTRIVCGNQPEIVSRRGCEKFDRVVWTAGLPLLAEIIPDIPLEVKQKAESVSYVAVSCLVLVLRSRLGSFYWLNNIDPALSFGAAIEHTNFIPPERYGGRHVLYVSNYHRDDDPRFGLPLARGMLELHLPSLKKLYPGFREQDIVRVYRFRDRFSSPVYDLNYLERMPPYQGWLPGIDIVCMAQVYPVDRNLNNCIGNAQRYLEECC